MYMPKICIYAGKYYVGGGGNAILGHVHLENPKMALENMALNSLKWPLNQKY